MMPVKYYSLRHTPFRLPSFWGRQAACIVPFLLSLLVISPRAIAGVFPVEGAKLNYRIVGFSFPALQDVTNYKIEVSTGMVADESLFRPQITSARSTTNKIIAELPSFGTEYTWRIVYTSKINETKKSALYHFSTGTIPQANNPDTRLRTLKKNKNFHSYVMLNGTRTMYDMEGKPVWYLPDTGGLGAPSYDIKYTDRHTITFLCGQDAYEVNYEGTVLWKAPVITYYDTARQTNERMMYHHEFTRLPNGHYMALASKNVSRAGLGADAGGRKRGGQFNFFPKIVGSTLYEFDSTGSIVWSWKSADYYEHSDLYSFYNDNITDAMLFGHENSFYFDDKNKVIYVSYSGFNRIVEISYPSGKVLNTYGKTYKAGNTQTASAGRIAPSPIEVEHMFENNLFLGQHSCRISKDGTLILFNNNMYDTGVIPQVVRFREDASGQLKKIWAFDCSIGDYGSSQQNGGGGNVNEMDDGSVFVSMNFPFGKVFIVDKNKNLLWSAQPEKKTDGEKWDPAPSYRASILSQRELEQLIWTDGAH